MVPEVKKLIRTLIQLPPDEQARRAEELLDDLNWSELTATPASQKFLSDMAAKVRQEHAEGKLKDLDDFLDEVENES